MTFLAPNWRVEVHIKHEAVPQRTKRPRTAGFDLRSLYYSRWYSYLSLKSDPRIQRVDLERDESLFPALVFYDPRGISSPASDLGFLEPLALHKYNECRNKVKVGVVGSN